MAPPTSHSDHTRALHCVFTQPRPSVASRSTPNRSSERQEADGSTTDRAAFATGGIWRSGDSNGVLSSQRLLETNSYRDLYGMTLVSPLVSEFVKILEAQRHLLSGQDKIQSDAESVDSVALRFLCGRDVGPGLGCGLPLAITH